MEARQDPSATKDGDYSSPTPESLLFVDMADRSQASQAASRRKARSHIMNRRHRRTRKLRGLKPTHSGHSSETSRVTPVNEDLRLVKITRMTSPRMAPTVTDVLGPVSEVNFDHLGHCTYTEDWNQLAKDHESQEATSIVQLHTPILSRQGLFSTLPFQLDHRDLNLLFHYEAVFKYTNIPVNSKEAWMRFAVTDAALLHMTLVISALHVALIRGKEFSVDAFRHQKEAIKIIDARLNDPIINTTDPTILAISCLALTEILNASPLKAASHLTAIEELVKQRGGLQALGFNGIVRRKVLWADLSSAVSQQIPPRFPCSPEILSLESPPDEIQVTIDTLAATICTEEVSNFVTAFHYPSDLCTVMRDLQYISIVLYSFQRTDITKIDQLNLSDSFYAIERRAYELLQARFRHQPKTATSADVSYDSKYTHSFLYTACCLTSLIYVSVALREIPPRAGFFNTLIERLTAVVQSIDIVGSCAMYPKILLWILGTGGVAALGRKQRGWYVKKLAAFCQDRNIYEWHAMREAFGAPWHLAPRYIKEFMDVWDEVEEFRIMRDLE